MKRNNNVSKNKIQHTSNLHNYAISGYIIIEAHGWRSEGLLMNSLKSHEKVIFEKLFDRDGYVLNFTDRTFSEFFNELNVNIDDPKYSFNGSSKMKRLRAFWQIENDNKVGEVLEGLIRYADAITKIDQEDKAKARNIINRLLGKKPNEYPENESDFLNLEFSKLDLKNLNLEPLMETIVNQRIDEIKKSLQSNAPLAILFLCGSTLEGLLLDVASKNIQNFNTAKSSPLDKDSKVKKLHNWTLENLINVSHEVGLIGLDVKKHSHELKDFRNYIHPRQQASQGFNPDMHTAKISWQVLQAAIADLSGDRK